MYGSNCWTGWTELIPQDQWKVYRRVLEEATSRLLPFSLGGAFATATHTGQWRGTNDMDVYVEPRHRHAIIATLGRLGLHDVQQESPYDPSAIYRASQGGAIVEVIWGMKNHRAEVDRTWVTRGEMVKVAGLALRITPPEEMIWPKLYVLNRDRSDWPDVLNLIYFCGEGMDWQHLLDRLGEDAPLLAGALCVLGWLSPQSIQKLPAWLFDALGLRKQALRFSSQRLATRPYLLRQQGWFGAALGQSRSAKTG